ncbi:MAG: alkaline phosphatase D family protein [Pirellulales bacterium]|nr:alkaline phosphatase D family protein [Pirellulales bacterium]
MRLTKLANDVQGWVGFRFAAHGLIGDYRHAVIYGHGIEAGWTHDNYLFLGDKRKQFTASENRLANGTATLELSLVPQGRTHAATLRLLGENQEELGALKASFPSVDLHGNLALVCHAPKQRKKTRPTAKSREVVASFSDWRIDGSDLSGGNDQAWGPILWCQYTLSRNILKLSAQFPPLGAADSKEAELQVFKNGRWEPTATAAIDPVSRVALFRVDGWHETEEVPYKVLYNFEGREHSYPGIIQHDPIDQTEIAVAGFTGNKDYGFPNREIVSNVKRLSPDLLFFSGDQIYETNGGYGIIRQPFERAVLDYLHKWYLFGWSFGDLLSNHPSVILPDDHDVYQGNIWGQGGRPAKRIENGGYIMSPDWVNMIQHTQTAHLPDPFDSTPVKQNIGVYYTDLLCGRVSFAVLEDRKFKTGPRSQKGIVENSSQANLLGERQLTFLRDWAADWRGCDMKATLSQTVFAQCHTHGGKENEPIGPDTDANGWPQSARNRALREIRKGFAFMVAGDNHLPTVVHHGIDTWEDAGVSFTVPSIAAGFPRAWWPYQADIQRHPAGPDYTGRFTGLWGHPLTMLAAANPQTFVGHKATVPGDLQLLQEKASGFGLVRFNTGARKITIECWKLLANSESSADTQYQGWPITIDQQTCYGRHPKGWLPTLEVSGIEDPVVHVIDESTGEKVYSIRIKGQRFSLKVFQEGSYTLRVGDGAERWQERSQIQSIKEVNHETIVFRFD